jgi:hypothetical protein
LVVSAAGNTPSKPAQVPAAVITAAAATAAVALAGQQKVGQNPSGIATLAVRGGQLWLTQCEVSYVLRIGHATTTKQQQHLGRYELAEVADACAPSIVQQTACMLLVVCQGAHSCS